MINSTVVNDGLLDSKVLEDLYNEAMELSGAIVEYFQVNKKDNLSDLDADVMGAYTLECNRITSGIMQAISWCLMQKGVHSGEITSEEASLEDNRLSDNELFSTKFDCDISEFPEAFIFVSERTRDLYNRIVRVDRLLYESKDDGINPVHGMINKIKNTDNL